MTDDWTETAARCCKTLTFADNHNRGGVTRPMTACHYMIWYGIYLHPLKIWWEGQLNQTHSTKNEK